MLHIHNAKSAKKAARSLEKFTQSLGFELKHGQALDALAAMCGFQNWAALGHSLSQEALDGRLGAVELEHIENNDDVTYGPEAAVIAHNGFELRYDDGGELLNYVRICDPLGREIAYWDNQEWADAPQLVMGAIFGALTQGEAVAVGEKKSSVRPLASTRGGGLAPSIMDLYPFDTVSHVVVDGSSFIARYCDEEVAQVLEDTAGDPEVEGDAHHVVLHLYQDDDGRETEHTLTVADLRALRWSDERGGFVSESGTLYEFYLESKFTGQLPGARRAAAPPARGNAQVDEATTDCAVVNDAAGWTVALEKPDLAN